MTVSLNDQVIFSKRTVRPSGSYNTMLEFTFGEVEITDKNSVLKIENTASSGMYLKEIKFVDMVMMAKKEAILKLPRPYKMSYLPCIIQAENYDVGASGVAFKDLEDVNSGGKYREIESVDIYEDGGMYYVNMLGEEWMTYTIKCLKSGNYDLLMKVLDKMESSKM